MSIEFLQSADGSLTLYHPTYQESYHSVKDGAFRETLDKHILPPIHFWNALQKPKLHILDICFGLGYNTFVSVWQYLQRHYDFPIHIFSPEKDQNIFEILLQLDYPEELKILGGKSMQTILLELQVKQKCQIQKTTIECFLGDALDYIKGFEDGFFDIVYQDAFSPNKNPELWSEEYFSLLYSKLTQDGIVTTYSQSANVKNNAKKSGFFVYEIKQDKTRDSRIFSKQKIKNTFLREK